jgi:xanthine/uracil permease
MAGATIIAPLLMGFDPNLALLFSGVGTLIFFVVVAGRVPSYLGSSFSFIAVVIAASGYSGHGPNPTSMLRWAASLQRVCCTASSLWLSCNRALPGLND